LQIKLVVEEDIAQSSLLIVHPKYIIMGSKNVIYSRPWCISSFKKNNISNQNFEHTIKSTNIVKQNDGYSIPNGIIILFNVIYPKKLSKSVITQLKQIDF
jgi:hypothetical protein